MVYNAVCLVFQLIVAKATLLTIGGYMLKRIVAITAILSATTMAQQFYEASGHTQVFTLAAGARANPAGIARGKQHVTPAAPRLFLTTHNGLWLHVQNSSAKAFVSIYNITGRRILNVDIDGATPIALSKSMPSGVYFARLEMNGRIMHTVRFRMVR
jgi:hypothetical protein